MASSAVAPMAMNPKDPVYEGWVLKKRRKKMQGYARRYFVLHADGVLEYSTHPGSTPRDNIPLKLATISSSERNNQITVDNGTKTFHIKTDDFAPWMSAFRLFLNQHDPHLQLRAEPTPLESLTDHLSKILAEMDNTIKELEVIGSSSSGSPSQDELSQSTSSRPPQLAKKRSAVQLRSKKDKEKEEHHRHGFGGLFHRKTSDRSTESSHTDSSYPSTPTTPNTSFSQSTSQHPSSHHYAAPSSQLMSETSSSPSRNSSAASRASLPPQLISLRQQHAALLSAITNIPNIYAESSPRSSSATNTGAQLDSRTPSYSLDLKARRQGGSTIPSTEALTPRQSNIERIRSSELSPTVSRDSHHRSHPRAVSSRVSLSQSITSNYQSLTGSTSFGVGGMRISLGRPGSVMTATSTGDSVWYDANDLEFIDMDSPVDQEGSAEGDREGRSSTSTRRPGDGDDGDSSSDEDEGPDRKSQSRDGARTPVGSRPHPPSVEQSSPRTPLPRPSESQVLDSTPPRASKSTDTQLRRPSLTIPPPNVSSTSTTSTNSTLSAVSTVSSTSTISLRSPVDEETLRRQMSTSQSLVPPSDSGMESVATLTGIKEGEAVGAAGVVRKGTIKVIKRRTRLPATTSGEQLSLFTMLKRNIGKDLSTVAFPVSFNEPLSLLQHLAEDLEYTDVLEKAVAETNPMKRLAFVAAFAVSGYACTKLRASRKPFNPLLGETFEDIRYNFIAEKVSHHPPVVACHAHGDGWEFWATSGAKNKFWGKSLEIIPTGTTCLKIGDETYSWQKPSSFMRNLIAGEKYLEHCGFMTITTSSSSLQCTLEFKEGGFWGTNKDEVIGKIVSSPSTLHAHSGADIELRGRWNTSFSQLLDTSGNHLHVLWRATAFPNDAPDYYGFTHFAIGLNEITEDIRDSLPPTDSRFRPDQKALEEGDVDWADAEKGRVEQAQRERRQEREKNGVHYQAKWFRPVGGKDGAVEWEYVGGYWEARERKEWGELEKLW